MKAQKLPSGSWRYQCRRTIADGTHQTLSVTFAKWSDRFAAADQCRRWQQEAKSVRKADVLVSDAIAAYIDRRARGGKSCATIRAYKSMERTAYAEISRIKIDRLTDDDCQSLIDSWINDGASPKTVKNRWSLLRSAVRSVRRSWDPYVELPSVRPPDIVTPSADEIVILLRAVSGTDLEIPVLLAAFGPMRRGEICALDASDIEGDIVHVRRALAREDGGGWEIKQPKSAAGIRDIRFPAAVIRKLPTGGRVCAMTPDDLTRRFAEAVAPLRVRHFTLHGLRHFAASQCHALGIPDAYTSQRAGWSKVATMRQHYLHILPPEQETANTKINDAFAAILAAV